MGGKSFGINIPLAEEVKLPRYEFGGTVPGARGSEVPIMAHGQEQIIPAGKSRNNGSPTFITNIYNPRVNSTEDLSVLKQQVESVFRDVVRNYRLQTQ